MIRALAFLAVLTVTCPGSAQATPQPEPSGASDAATRAGKHYTQGYALARTQEYAAASVEFELAYALSPHYSVLYNLGHSYAKSGRPVEAAAAFRRYLLEGGADGDPELKERALVAIEENEKNVGRLHVEFSPRAAARARIDGRSVEPSELRDSVPLVVGTHALWVSAQGQRDVQLSFAIRAGEATDLKVQLEPNPQKTATRPSPLPATSGSPSSLRTWSYALAGAGATLGVAAALIYSENSASYDRWRRRRDELASHLGGSDSASQQAELSGVLGELSKRQRLDDVSLVLGASAAVCLGVSGYLFWKSYDREGHGVQVAVTPNGLNWSGRW